VKLFWGVKMLILC